MRITETFFALAVGEMPRAMAFYVRAFGATVSFASPGWASLHVAGVRVGLYSPGTPGPTGLHFVVDDLAAACAEVERAGGRVARGASEVAPGVVVADVVDSEGNTLTLRGP